MIHWNVHAGNALIVTGLPAQQETLAQHYAASLAGIPPGLARDGGIAVGEIAAAAMLAAWANDGRFGAYLFWRPITAIREAERDGNPATQPDSNWTPLINTPPYPDHPSGLTCVGAAEASSLRDFFDRDRMAFSVTSSVSTTTRSFTSFSQAVREIVDARVYSGIHFRRADEEGALIGKRVARYRDRHYFGPERGRHRERPM